MEVANVPSDATASATSSDEATSNNNLLSRARRCARTARDKIHGFARSLRRRSLGVLSLTVLSKQILITFSLTVVS